MSLTTQSTTTQCAMVLQALRAGRALTPLDALDEFGCFRLAARIHDLRLAGCNIVTTRETNGDKHWAVYRLLKDKR